MGLRGALEKSQVSTTAKETYHLSHYQQAEQGDHGEPGIGMFRRAYSADWHARIRDTTGHGANQVNKIISIFVQEQQQHLECWSVLCVPLTS